MSFIKLLRKIIQLMLVMAGFILAGWPVANAQSIGVSGDGVTTFHINRTDFDNMKQHVVMAKAHDERIHRYTGVAIADLLAKGGLTLGDSAKRNTVVSYVEVTAADGYKAIYALAEIDPLFASRPIILADKSDKKNLPDSVGPFQVIVPADKKHARWVRQVTDIRLVLVKK